MDCPLGVGLEDGGLDLGLAKMVILTSLTCIEIRVCVYILIINVDFTS